MKKLRRITIPSFDKYEDLIYIGLAVCFALSIFCAAVWGAPRSSGASTQCIGLPCDQLYLTVAREEPGYFSDSTDSVNNNFIIISSAINRLEVIPNNTNYIQLRNTLQSGATFYVASGTVNRFLYVNGNLSIGNNNTNAVVDITSSTTNITDLIFLISSGPAATSNLLRIQRNGRIVIGTVTANAALEIANSDANLRLNNTASGGRIYEWGSSDDGDSVGGGRFVLNDLTANQTLINANSTSSISMAFSSFTLSNASTFYLNSNSSRIVMPSSPTICHQQMALPLGPILIRSSSPVGAASFESVQISYLLGTNAKMAHILTQCYITHSGGGALEGVMGHIRPANSTIASGQNATAKCRARELSSGASRPHEYNTSWVILNSTMTFAIYAQLEGSPTSATVDYLLEGWCE